MRRPLVSAASPALAGRVLLGFFALSGPAAAQGTNSAVVGISISVQPVAEISFPDGYDFVIKVEDCDDHRSDGHHDDPGHNPGHSPGNPGHDQHEHHGAGHGSAGHIGHGGGSPHGGPDRPGHTESGHGGSPDDGNRHDHGRSDHDDHGRDRHDDHAGGPDGWFGGCRHGHEPHRPLTIHPVSIPFTIRGNALATVSVAPGSYLRTAGGLYLGEATGPHGRLGYGVVVRFPVRRPGHAVSVRWDEWDERGPWTGWPLFAGFPSWGPYAVLPGIDGVGTPPLTADMVRHRGEADGMIYLVAYRRWTASGRPASPGRYYGSVEVTVTADNR